ncbi:MAG TPA: RraA family protein [Lacipirellulaceae bacterium]|jgi:regulator of RNase E activity RraA|nr:RraA family protein [Lacipirellulaceae bacterium]
MESIEVTADTLRKLARFDTPTICNVIELFDIRPRDVGYMDHRIKAAFPDFPPMVGFAATATMRCASPLGQSTYDAMEAQLKLFEQLLGPAVVVFQDLDDPPVAATFGEVMCSTYKAFGAVGIVTSGGGRDLDQVRALGFPAFTGSTICSHGYTQIIDVGSPARVGGLVVASGDLLHGDCNGVTNIPLEIATEVADAAEEFVAAEAHVLDYVKGSGPKTITELAVRRKAMGDAIATLRRRLSGH